MRKIFLLAMSAVLLATSCDKNDDNINGSNRPSAYRFAVVMGVDVDPVSDDAADDSTAVANIYFMLDSDETFVVSENVSKTNLDDLKIGERVIMGVTLTASADGEYDYTAKLYEVVSVFVGDHTTITDQAENDSIADHRLSYIATAATLTHGYLNLLVGVETNDVDNVKFYLADNQYNDPMYSKDDYLYLELRYDRSGDDSDGKVYERYLSFDMESYREQLADKDGVVLRVRTERSSAATLMVDSENLF